MKHANLSDARSPFQVLLRSAHSSAAVMRLEAGQASSEEPNSHADSDQILLLVEGELTAEIAEESRRLRQGDVVLVPAGTPHRFVNAGSRPALTFNVYAPPAY